MIYATAQGKKFALAKLAERRINRPTLPDNSSLPAGAPMYFACLTCGAVISVPEDYIDRPDLCDECNALKKLGWLE